MASALTERLFSRRTLLVGALLAAFASPLHAAELKRWKGKPAAPDIDLLTTDGAPLSLQQLRGKVVLVNFWATWCEPCITEMPSLQRLHDQLRADGFEVLAVNYQEGPARINSFIEKMNLKLPVVRDTDGSVARAWGARVFPANYLVDRAGNIRHSMDGAADWTSPSLVSTIRTLLAAQPSR
jgi:peroxiredoxin